MIEMTEKEKQELQDYKDDYGSDAYGFTAFILNKVRIFSIPLCFLGITDANGVDSNKALYFYENAISN